MTGYSQEITRYIGKPLAYLKLQPSRIDTVGYRMLPQAMAQTCKRQQATLSRPAEIRFLHQKSAAVFAEIN